MSPALRLAGVLALVVSGGCDLFLGPSPLNDAPIIHRVGPLTFTDADKHVISTGGLIDVDRERETRIEIDAEEPEGEPLTLAVGPLPRGWSFDEAARVIVAQPDARQASLEFVVYVVAEDAHDPPAYDVRTIDFLVR